MLRITDKAFRYTPSHKTDLAMKFRNIESDRRRAAEAITPSGEPPEAPPAINVPLRLPPMQDRN